MRVLKRSFGAAAVAAMSTRTQGPTFKVCEKRLDVERWNIRGQNYKGSHFPICAFTNNVGRRSPERLQARHERGASRSGGWRGWGGNAPGGWGGWDWGGWDGAWEGGAWEGSSGSSLGRTT